ncbi:MAG: PRC-barrel domain-containing protein [Candidatus Berkelbacteria bacterium]|nr:PRC-barrel domain-containing protein [Candidatus Berkelbacteria bacterium]
MMIEAKKLIGMPVAAFDTQSKIGEIRELIIDPENGHLMGFLVQVSGLFSAGKILSEVDIREWDPNGIVTEKEENLVEPEEIVRIDNILKKKINLIGIGAKTESGKSLGNVENLLIDTDTSSVTKYYLKDMLGNSRIFTSEKVVKIDKFIIFSDDVAELPTGAAGVPA